MNKTTIEWTDYTWNPVTGCTKVSQGCKFCYAEGLFKRFGKHWGHQFTNVTHHHDRLSEPLAMGKKLHGKKVFVCDMSDLFHEKVTDQFIARVFREMSKCPDTIFQVLTKRPERAVEFFSKIRFGNAIIDMLEAFGLSQNGDPVEWPLPNVWIGTSCEDQKTADERIPLLLQIPAAVRFLSCEPLLGPIDLEYIQREGHTMSVLKGTEYDGDEGIFHTGKIDWVIAGGESGHKARPMHPDWARSLRDQCAAAGVPFFFKQWGEWANAENRLQLPILRLNGTADYTGHKFEWAPTLGDGSRPVRIARVGKHKSGNLLDGKEHKAFPRTKPSATILTDSSLESRTGKSTIQKTLVQTEPTPGPSDD